MRVIVAARLSVLAEGQTGLDSQEQEAVRWAEQQGHEIVEVVKDHKTGKSHLWDRPNLKHAEGCSSIWYRPAHTALGASSARPGD